jgi:aryl-alcohol dehydrogenase-like predicted oxidoreductase
LERLKTDRIDLYQTHWQDTTTPFEDTMATLQELKTEGKIRAIGVCNATAAQMEAYQQAGALDTDQEPYSMLDRGIESDQLPHCRKHGMAMLAYSPLARGLLTGKVGPQRQFAPGDHRGEIEMFSVENRRRVLAMLEEILPIADEHEITLTQLVIAWTVHQPGLTHALCGARNIEQARENAAAGDVELSQAEIATIDRAIAAR